MALRMLLPGLVWYCVVQDGLKVTKSLLFSVTRALITGMGHHATTVRFWTRMSGEQGWPWLRGADPS